jgi:hypothetical protein
MRLIGRRADTLVTTSRADDAGSGAAVLPVRVLRGRACGGLDLTELTQLLEFFAVRTTGSQRTHSHRRRPPDSVQRVRNTGSARR